MNKQELIDRLKASRNWNHFNDCQEWQDAFLLYNAVHGLSGKEVLRMNCTRCFNTVKDWLQQIDK